VGRYSIKFVSASIKNPALTPFLLSPKGEMNPTLKASATFCRRLPAPSPLGEGREGGKQDWGRLGRGLNL